MYYEKEGVGDIFSKENIYERQKPRGPYPKGTDEEFLARILELELNKVKVNKGNLEKKLE